MKKTLFLSMLVVFFTMSFPSVGGCNHQIQSDEDYELQKQCEIQCAEWFLGKYEHGIKDSDDGKRFNYYHNHHNKKLNKCFMIIGNVFFSKNKTGIRLKKSLFVVNENKEFGVFSKVIQGTNPNQPPRSKLPRYARNVVISQQAAENQHASRLSGIECYLENKVCKSEKEWNSLVKPFMEE